METGRTRQSRKALVERFFSGTGSTYDWVVNAATFGIDRRWKRRIVASIPPGANRILDLACGTGILTLAIARRFSAAQVVGVELREEYLALAREKLQRTGVASVALVLSRAEDYLDERPFDAIVSSYLAKYAELDVLTKRAHEMLVPGGFLLMHDFTYPPTRALARLWRLYLGLLRALGGPLLPAWYEILHGLPRLIEETRWTEELTTVLRREGFEHIHCESLTLHGSAIVTARRPQADGGFAPAARAGTG